MKNNFSEKETTVKTADDSKKFEVAQKIRESVHSHGILAKWRTWKYFWYETLYTYT